MTNASGAVYWNAIYPGHIHVPENTAYSCKTDGIDCLVIIVRHHEPITVTDFSNDFVLKKKGTIKHIFLKKPIPYHPENTIFVDFRATGNPIEQHAFWTKEQKYKVYRKQSFTEITVAVECLSDSSHESQDINLFIRSINRFIEVYRLAAMDPTILKFQDLRNNIPVIRRCYVPYNPMLN